VNRAKPLYLSIAFFYILSGTGCQKNNSNPLPVANAGPSQVITLPTDTVTLTGTASDPKGKIVSYLWDQVSGPAASTIADPGALSTIVTGLLQGSYIFQLSVFDGQGGIGTDTILVVVKPPLHTTLTLQPSNNPNELTIGVLGGADASGPSISTFGVTAWTASGNQWVSRGLIKFDLTTIPSTATIESANLYLYSDSTPTTGNLVDANYGSNSFTLQQVNSNWVASGVTWFNQPVGLMANQIIIPSTSQSFLDLDIDVTSMVGNMVNNNANYGFLLQLQSELPYSSRIFVASHSSPASTRYPKLVVVYQ
jgi:hypothetical protein